MPTSFDNLPGKIGENITRAIAILKAAGCTDIFLFGSLARGDPSSASDIDLAVRGCPKGAFFRVLGKLMMELEYPVDVVNLDRPNDFNEYLEREGELQQIG